jgi:hypothetical protein
LADIFSRGLLHLPREILESDIVIALPWKKPSQGEAFTLVSLDPSSSSRDTVIHS